MTSFHLNYFLKALSPNTGALEIRVSVYEFWRDTIQSTTFIFDNFCEAPVLETGEERVCLTTS